MRKVLRKRGIRKGNHEGKGRVRGSRGEKKAEKGRGGNAECCVSVIRKERYSTED